MNQNDLSGVKTTQVFQGFYRPGEARHLPFVPEMAGEFYCVDNYYTERSAYPQCLLIYTLSGKGLVRYQGEEKTVSAGELTAINCEQYQYYATARGCHWHFLWVHFSGPCAAAYTDMLNAGRLTVAKGDFEERMKRLLCLLRDRSADSACEASLELHRLLRALHRAAPSSGKKRRAVQRTLEYLDRNFHRQVRLEELAALVSLSKYHLLRLFSAETGVTPYEYLLRRRVECARGLLAQSALTVEEIAEQSGFCDAKNFITHFRKRTGVTPLSYRNSLPFR